MEIDKTYFEQHANELLGNAGYTKARFADAMGIARQNVLKLFETKNVATLSKVAAILGVPLTTLIHGNVPDEKHSVDGFVEIDGKTYRIRNKKDIKSLLDLLSD